MRKHIEIDFVKSHPDLFENCQKVLLGMEQPTDETNLNLKNWSYRQRNSIFDCGEGWLPIIKTVAECLEEALRQLTSDKQGSEITESPERPCIRLNTARRFCEELEINIDFTNIPPEIVNTISGIQIMASMMSKKICEPCGELHNTNMEDNLCRTCVLKKSGSHR